MIRVQFDWTRKRESSFVPNNPNAVATGHVIGTLRLYPAADDADAAQTDSAADAADARIVDDRLDSFGLQVPKTIDCVESTCALRMHDQYHE